MLPKEVLIDLDIMNKENNLIVRLLKKTKSFKI